MSLHAEAKMCGTQTGVRQWAMPGHGPAVVEVGTKDERLRVYVQPSGAYAIEVVDADGNVKDKRIIIHTSVPARFGHHLYRRAIKLRRKRITGHLKGGNGK